MPAISPRPCALEQAQLDPLVRNHMHIAALALAAAGQACGAAQLVRHLDPWALDSLAREHLHGALAALVLRYLGALTPTQCRLLVGARNRLELELEGEAVR